MRKYISCDDLLDAILSLPAKMDEDGYGWLGRRGVWQMVSDFPASDVVSKHVYDQTDWERVVALTQLKQIGKGLGERMDDIVSLSKNFKDCRNELCLKCGQYKTAYLGSCDGCRWRAENG